MTPRPRRLCRNCRKRRAVGVDGLCDDCHLIFLMVDLAGIHLLFRVMARAGFRVRLRPTQNDRNGKDGCNG